MDLVSNALTLQNNINTNSFKTSVANKKVNQRYNLTKDMIFIIYLFQKYEGFVFRLTKNISAEGVGKEKFFFLFTPVVFLYHYLTIRVTDERFTGKKMFHKPGVSNRIRTREACNSRPLRHGESQHVNTLRVLTKV